MAYRPISTRLVFFMFPFMSFIFFDPSLSFLLLSASLSSVSDLFLGGICLLLPRPFLADPFFVEVRPLCLCLSLSLATGDSACCFESPTPPPSHHPHPTLHPHPTALSLLHVCIACVGICRLQAPLVIMYVFACSVSPVIFSLPYVAWPRCINSWISFIAGPFF